MHLVFAGILHALILSSCEGCGSPSKTNTPGGDAAALTPSVPGISTLGFPAELKTYAPALELSGVAWSSSLQRYLMVSDDTAQEGGKRTKHAPLIFSMTAAGALDPTPLRIEGLDELNDPESITAGPDDTVFLATSHSLNKKGHLPASRRKLLHLAIAGRALRIIGQVDLTETRSAEGKTLLEIARLPADGALDIEAIHFREAALYIGLKAPLATDGSASILRMADPVAALASGKIPVGAVAFWSRARLCQLREGRDVCAGIADMTSLPDGSMLLVGNAPKGMPSDGGGSLWRLDGADKPAVFLQQFPGLRPEGITITPDGASAAIVFDTGGQPPQWTLWTLPKRAIP